MFMICEKKNRCKNVNFKHEGINIDTSFDIIILNTCLYIYLYIQQVVTHVVLKHNNFIKLDMSYTGKTRYGE